MAYGQLAHCGCETSLAVRRRICPASTRHTQRAAHTIIQHAAPSASAGLRSPTSRPMTVAAAAGARPPASAPSPPPPQQQQQPAHGLVGTLPFLEEDYVEVGRVAGAHGVRGELRLELSTDQPAKRFRVGRRLYLLPPSAQGLAARANPDALPLISVTCKGAKARPMGKGTEAWMVTVEGVTTRTQAESLRGHLVLCAAADRDALRDPDEFYVTDIIGCTVIDQASRRMLGVVVDMFSGMGTHDTLRVKLRANEEDILQSRIRYVLIPFARSICPVLDLSSRCLEVVPPEGLFELATAEKMKKPLSDAAKAQKLAQLREALAGEAAMLQQQKQQRGDEGGEAAAAAKPGQEEEEDEDADAEEAAAEEEEEGGSGGGGVRRRRPGLRRRPGSLRLGRRRE
ncbi:hypothetical protein PLESTM_000931700 [Pleodorina starrii]|nr:hypothetical protein PLESTM_000931700 [Pleodorina starrii]